MLAASRSPLSRRSAVLAGGGVALALFATGLLWAKYGGRIYVDAILASLAGCF